MENIKKIKIILECVDDDDEAFEYEFKNKNGSTVDFGWDIAKNTNQHKIHLKFTDVPELVE